MKRILGLLLCICIIIFLIPQINIFAASQLPDLIPTDIIYNSNDLAVANITTANVLIIGDYAFELGDASYTLNNYLTAAQTAYSVDGVYQIYYFTGSVWYDLVSDEDLSTPITDLNTINGDGLYTFWNMIPNQTDKAPDFTVFDADGNEVKLSDFFGKPIVLNFWASWCSPCKSEMPHFNEVYNDTKDDVTFIMIDLETVKTGQLFIEESGYTFPVYFDTNQNAAYTYGISAIPTTIFINKDGIIIKEYIGSLDKETLLKNIDSITE